MADGTVVIDTRLDSSGFTSGLAGLGSVTKGGLKVTTAAIAAVTSALTACATYSLKVGSDFEAGMSQVEAISSASSKQVTTSTGDIIDGFTALSEKAKEMGSTTKFSATESAEALNYMAMAGWEPQQMYDGLAGVMTLAAASGEDLATTADIVTDALTAFGMEAGDAGHFADVLAQVSASANTNVSLLGETFKYVAPLCGTLGYSAEDASIAIGLMANSGIKGSQAGTALKTALANMAAPTKAMSAQMDALGISLTNADGSSKSLMEVLVNLRSSFSGLSETEQTAAASAIFGKEAMSGMLAIINASDEDFNNLTEAIYGCDGAAEQMAATMQDNLQGQITILKSGVEGLGIAVYEKLQEPLKNLAKEGSNYITQLTQAFNTSGFEGLVSEMGTIMADVLAQVMKIAPTMVDAAVSVIESFISGLQSAIPGVGQAVAEVGTTILEAIFTIVPELLTLGIDLILSVAEGVAQAAPNLITAFTSAVMAMVSTVYEHTPELLQAGLDLLQGLADGILSSIPIISETAPEIISSLCENLSTQLPQMLEAAGTIITGLVSGLLECLPQLMTAGMSIMQSLCEFIITNLPQLMTAGMSIMQGLGEYIITNLPTIIQAAMQIVTQLGTTIISAIPNLAGSITSVMDGILGFVVDNLPTIAESAVEIITQLCTTLVSLIPQLVPVVADIIMNFFNFVVNNLPTVIQSANQVMQTLVTGIINQIPTLIPAVIQIISQLFSSIVSNLPTILAGAVQIIITLATGLIQGIPQVIAAIPQIVTAIIEGFANTDWASVGSNIISGIGSGIANAASGLVNIAVSAARNAIYAVKSWLGIASPSKRAKKEIGKWILPGISEGVEETEPELNEKMEGAAEDMTNAFQAKTGELDTDDLMENLKGKEQPAAQSINLDDAFQEQPEPLNVASLIAKMKAAVARQSGEISANVSLKTRSGSGQVAATEDEAFDYAKLGSAVVAAFIQSDVKVECGEREFGRLIAEVTPA